MSAWPSQRDSQLSWRRWQRVGGRVDFLLVPFLGVLLLLRVLSDDRSAPDSRHSGSLNSSAAIAVLFIVMAIGLLIRHRRGVRCTMWVALWLCVWTAIAVNSSGASTETLREGVREVSVLAIGVIAYNARGLLSVPVATRLLQLVGLAPALLALYQLATDTGLEVAHNIRANGTFAHPNSAAMFFAIVVTASLWRYLDNGRRRSDLLFTMVFAAALIATFSIDGLATLVAMLTVFGALHPGPARVKLLPWAMAGLVVLVFFATPLGAQRVADESSTSLSAAERGNPNSTLSTRLYRWKTLLPQWERSPVYGRGLGTTTTAENTSTNRLNSLLPHNEYLRFLVETGILGVAILLWALAMLLRRLLSLRRTYGTLNADALNAPALAIVIVAGCLINSLADNTLLNSPTCYAVALIVLAVISSSSADTPRAPSLRPA